MTMQANKDGFNGRLTEVALGYQRMLELNPFHAQSLVGMSLVAIASRPRSRWLKPQFPRHP